MHTRTPKEFFLFLGFAVFDEAGRELSLSDASSKVKVNWTNRLDAADVRKGFLPSIPVRKPLGRILGP